MQTAVDNLYMVKNSDETLYTVSCPSDILDVAVDVLSDHRICEQVTPLPIFAGLDLDHSALQFNYVMSNN